jgi:RNA polymerase sigma-70 factor, ECF subfamily
VSLRPLSKSHYGRNDDVQRSLKRSGHERKAALHDGFLEESQGKQIRMKTAINLAHTSAVIEFKTVGMTSHSQRKAHRLLRNRNRAFIPEHGLGELKPNTPDSLPLSVTIRLAQQGDAGAFEAIYQQHCRRVHALCLRMLRDPIEAEDLVQDVFVLLFRKINTFRGESAFSTWLHRLAANLVLMRLRKKSPPTVSIEAAADMDDETSSPAIDIGTHDLFLEGAIDRVTLDRCIERLPPGYRAIFVLHDVQGHQHKEISETLGRSIGVSKSQLHKARMRLRQMLHEVQREKARDERLAGCKLGDRSCTALLPLAATNS